jgi:hypothetical protein
MKNFSPVDMSSGGTTGITIKFLIHKKFILKYNYRWFIIAKDTDMIWAKIKQLCKYCSEIWP